jgi:hypothetical protein
MTHGRKEEKIWEFKQLYNLKKKLKKTNKPRIKKITA